MKLPPPFTIYDLRFTISKKSGRAAGPLTAADGAHGVTRSTLFNRKSPIVNRKWEQGIALVITLIMLAITLVMAVAFLALARRERGSVTTSTDTTTARLAAETALANAQAQIVASMLTGSGNPYNLGLLVSTNYINPAGFDNTGGPNGSANPTNVNYDHLLNSGTALTPLQLCQNISNLFYLPRAPVLANVDTNDFAGRFYLDLNQNGKFDPNGVVTNVDANNNILLDPPVTGNPVVTVQTGDPEWVGVLEHPDATHGPNNKFISRYAFIALPVGNSLDVNYIHNQVFDENNPGVVNPPPIADGFFRNQGVGSWELNLAAFLADLNTNIWSPVPLPANLYYAYNQPNSANSGIAFEDARALLAYRYGNNYLTLANAYGCFTNLANYPSNSIDGYSDGPLQTTLSNNAAVSSDNISLRWAGSNNTNRLFALADLMNPNITATGVSPAAIAAGNDLTGRLLKAATNTYGGTTVPTYDRYTYYRMLNQLGTDSAADEGKLNLNYSNAVVNYANNNGVYVVSSIGVVAGAETNLVPWAPQDFFLAAADQLLRVYSTNWYNASYQNYTNNYGVTVPFSITNIPVWVSNRFVYTPAVNRLLQLAANIYDATTNGNNNLPHVFRPVFERDNYGDIFIVSYMAVTNVTGISDNQLASPYDAYQLTNFVSSFTPITGPNVYNNNSICPVNVYGVPWIIGAKKGLPNFNQFYMVNAAQVVRKLQVVRPNMTKDFKQYYTNQMYVMSITNHIGFSFWNSYANSRPGNYTIVLNDTLKMSQFVTNSSGNLLYSNGLVTGFNYKFQTNFWAGSSWGWNGQYGSYATPRTESFIAGQTDIPFLTESILRYLAGSVQFEPYTSGALWDNGVQNLPAFPHFQLATANWVQGYILDGNQVIDYVQNVSASAQRDLAVELQDPDYLTLNQPVYMWSTNLTGPQKDGFQYGPVNQIAVSLGVKTAPYNTWRDAPTAPGPIKPGEITHFHDFIYGQNFGDDFAQAPFTPARTMYDFTSLQANDPLVHYLASDLTDTDPGVTGTHRVDDPLTPFSAISSEVALNQVHQRYQPWGRSAQLSRSSLAGLVDTNSYNMRFRDSLVWGSDSWDFPTNQYPTVGWLGRVHRGTPWQTVYFKASNLLREFSTDSHGNAIYTGSNTWSVWTGDKNYYDAGNSAPLQDRLLPDIFTTRLNDNAVRGTLSVNQTHLASWSALFSGMVVLSNNLPNDPTILKAAVPVSYTNFIINPAGIVDAAAPPPLWQLLNHTTNGAAGINEARAVFTNSDGSVGVFEHAGDILSAPALTEQSPFLNLTGNQPLYGISDELYEWLPQQMMGLVRLGEPRYVVYCYGQALRPAPGGQVLGGPFFQLITNYQVAAESGIRAVIRIDNATTAHPHAVVESYNVLPPN